MIHAAWLFYRILYMPAYNLTLEPAIPIAMCFCGSIALISGRHKSFMAGEWACADTAHAVAAGRWNSATCCRAMARWAAKLYGGLKVPRQLGSDSLAHLIWRAMQLRTLAAEPFALRGAYQAIHTLFLLDPSFNLRCV